MTVYPRVCGGTMEAIGQMAAYIGLSPRVRGNPSGRVAHPVSKRSIPACAGEPCARRIVGWQDKVYPRVCGGTEVTNGRIRLDKGLSPRVRGNRCA